MNHLKKTVFTMMLLSTCCFASAQGFKEEVKKAYLKTCLNGADTIQDAYEQRLYRWWCDCSAEKVSNHFGMTDFLKMKFMDKKEAAQKVTDVIQPCTDEMKRNRKKYNEIKNKS